MSKNKIIGVVLWLLAIIPLHYCLLAAEHQSNRTGVISLLGLLTLTFAGYAFFDAGGKKADAAHGH